MASQHHPRVFIVEDDPLFLASMRALLTHAGYEVAESASSTAPELAGEFELADLIVLDLGLPDRDGFDVLREIRESSGAADKPVLMLTAHNPMKYRLRGLALGADDYIVKPPNREELLLRIAGLLRRSYPKCSQEQGPRIRVDHAKGGRGFVSASDVSHISAARNYCFVHTTGGRKLTSASISQLTEELEGTFLRVHRSHLVNPAKIRAARWESSSSYVLEMEDGNGAVIPVSRAYRNAVRGALGLIDGAAAIAH